MFIIMNFSKIKNALSCLCVKLRSINDRKKEPLPSLAKVQIFIAFDEDPQVYNYKKKRYFAVNFKNKMYPLYVLTGSKKECFAMNYNYYFKFQKVYKTNCCDFIILSISFSHSSFFE